MNEEQFSALTEKIYSAALDEAAWSGVLEDLRLLFHGSSAAVMAWRRADNTPILTLKNDRDTGYAQQYAEHYYKVDCRLQAAMNARRIQPHPVVGIGDMLISPDEFQKSEIYQDFLRNYDQCHMLFAGTENTPELLASFTVQRPLQHGAYDGDARQRLLLLAPHLKRGLRIYREMAALRGRAELFEITFDGLPQAVLLLDVSGKVAGLNSKARQLVDTADAITVRCGRLAAIDPRSDAALAAALQPQAGASPPPEILLYGPSPATSLRLTVTPLNGRNMPHWVDLNQQAQVAFLVTALPLAQPLPSPESLMQRYQLTVTEAEIALLLAQGAAGPEIAAHKAISINTVKAHVKNLHLKTGAQKRGELLAKLLGSG